MIVGSGLIVTLFFGGWSIPFGLGSGLETKPLWLGLLHMLSFFLKIVAFVATAATQVLAPGAFDTQPFNLLYLAVPIGFALALYGSSQSTKMRTKPSHTCPSTRPTQLIRAIRSGAVMLVLAWATMSSLHGQDAPTVGKEQSRRNRIGMAMKDMELTSGSGVPDSHRTISRGADHIHIGTMPLAIARIAAKETFSHVIGMAAPIPDRHDHR